MRASVLLVLLLTAALTGPPLVFADEPLEEATWLLLLTDADMRVRQETVDRLVDIGTDQARELLRLALYDPHPAVRQAAEQGLAELAR